MSKARMQTAAWWALGLALALVARRRRPLDPRARGPRPVPRPRRRVLARRLSRRLRRASRCCCARACAARSARRCGSTARSPPPPSPRWSPPPRPGRGAGALAYPLGDVLLLCLAAGATALLGRRAGRTFVLVAAGLALCAVADAARLLEGIEVRAPLAALVLACAAALPAETRRRSAPVGGAHVGLPAAFTLAALGVLLWDRQVARAQRRRRSTSRWPSRSCSCCGSRSACARTPGCSSARATRR